MSSHVFRDGSQVDLMMMLAAREQRTQTQQQLLASQPKASLLSATMNIPGPIKTSPMLCEVFEVVLNAVQAHLQLTEASILAEHYYDKVTGPEYYLLLDLPASQLKSAMIEVEESQAWGRLLDLDVLFVETQAQVDWVGVEDEELASEVKEAEVAEASKDKAQQAQLALAMTSIRAISRSDLNLPSRRCLICQEDAKVCGRSRKHSVADMQAAITHLIENERENVND